MLGAAACWRIGRTGSSRRGRSQTTRTTEARHAAATKQFNLIWQYYQQNRVQSFDVYYWSTLLLDASRGLSDNRDKQIAAYEEHLDRMQKLEALIRKSGAWASDDQATSAVPSITGSKRKAGWPRPKRGDERGAGKGKLLRSGRPPRLRGQSGRITQLARDRGATLEQVICNPLPLPRNVDR